MSFDSLGLSPDILRAYRTTLAKLAVSEPLDTTGMRLERRISAIYKDIPGGQLLGPTYDYTHRLLDFTLLANGETPTPHRLPELHKSDKRRFGFVFVKFHLLPPHLSEASSSVFWQFTIQM